MVNYGRYRKVVVNGLEYVCKEDFIKQLEDHVKQFRGDWDGDSEAQVAIDQIIQSMYRI